MEAGKEEVRLIRGMRGTRILGMKYQSRVQCMVNVHTCGHCGLAVCAVLKVVSSIHAGAPLFTPHVLSMFALGGLH